MKTQPSKRVVFQLVATKEPQAEEEEEETQPSAGDEDGDDLVVSDKPRSPCHFTILKELVICFSIVFYIADLCLDFWVCAVHFTTDRASSAWFIFFCILLPNLYAGYKSLQWYLRAHEITPIRRPAVWIIRVFFFPISPILRYIDAWVYGRRAKRYWREQNFAKERKNFESYLVESAEVAMLRLVIIFLEDAPIVVLNISQLILGEPEDKPKPKIVSPYWRLGCVVAKLACTMTLGVVHYMSCNKLAWHLANQQQKQQQQQTGVTTPSPVESAENKGMLSWAAEITIYCWQLMSIGSRVVAYAIFSVVHFRLLWVPIMVRWIMHTVWIYFDVREMSLVNSIAFGGVYLFSFVTTAPGRQVLRILLYYVITFGEDGIIAILWVSGAPHHQFQEIGIGVMFGGAAGGLMFLMLYYCCCHPDKENVWARKWIREKTNSRNENRSNAV